MYTGRRNRKCVTNVCVLVGEIVVCVCMCEGDGVGISSYKYA